MVNISLIATILREQDEPGSVTTRQIRDWYNARSGEEPIEHKSDGDVEFQSALMKALKHPNEDDDDDDGDKPISYTVKLKDSDETPATKQRSRIKFSKEPTEQSESEESASDTEKNTASSITIGKPFSPLFMNNMKKFGVSSDWLSKRSNSLRQSLFSRSSVKSDTSRLDAMIKSASVKPVRSNRKLSFPGTVPKNNDENTEPIDDEKKREQEKPESAPILPPPAATAYYLSSEVEDEKDDDDGEERVECSPTTPQKIFSLRIPRVDLPDAANAGSKKRSDSSSSSDNEIKPTPPPKKIRKSKKSSTTTTTDETKQPPPKKDTNDKAQMRIDNLKKLLRTAGIRLMIRNAELDCLSSNKKKIDYLKSLFDTAGFTGNLNLKDCKKFRKKRDSQQELLDLQENAVDVKGHVKGGRTLRGQSTTTTASPVKRKRTASSEKEEEEEIELSEDEPIVKRRRVVQIEASPEVSECEQID